MIVKGRFLRGNREKDAKHLKAHFRYIEHRSRDMCRENREDRHLFNKDRDQVNRDEATSDVMRHTSPSVNYHKLMFSPGPDEPVNDYRQWMRDVMRDLEEQQDKELHWYASVHANTDHPHVHVVLAGSGEHLQTGKEEPVKLYQETYEHLRESAIAHSERAFYDRFLEDLQECRHRDTVLHELDEARDPEREPPREATVTIYPDEGRDDDL
jgi:type IV secretory pathway VirD2 relaxase